MAPGRDIAARSADEALRGATFSPFIDVPSGDDRCHNKRAVPTSTHLLPPLTPLLRRHRLHVASAVSVGVRPLSARKVLRVRPWKARMTTLTTTSIATSTTTKMTSSSAKMPLLGRCECSRLSRATVIACTRIKCSGTMANSFSRSSVANSKRDVASSSTSASRFSSSNRYDASKLDDPTLRIFRRNRCMTALLADNVQGDLQSAFDQLDRLILGFQREGSGWVIDFVAHLQVYVATNRPVCGSSYMMLPRKLAKKKAIVNPRNPDDEKCFIWAISSSLGARYVSIPNGYTTVNPTSTRWTFEGSICPCRSTQKSVGASRS
jgi:hypothetical protein